MTELSNNLQSVINDCQQMVDAIEENNLFDMWDVHSFNNWSSMVDILTEAKQRLDILEEQNSLMWKKQA